MSKLVKRVSRGLDLKPNGPSELLLEAADVDGFKAGDKVVAAAKLSGRTWDGELVQVFTVAGPPKRTYGLAVFKPSRLDPAAKPQDPLKADDTITITVGGEPTPSPLPAPTYDE